MSNFCPRCESLKSEAARIGWEDVANRLSKAYEDLGSQVEAIRAHYAAQLAELEEFEHQRKHRTPYSNGVSDMAQRSCREILERLKTCV